MTGMDRPRGGGRGKRGKAYATDQERITTNVTIGPSGCWEWNLTRGDNGYARLSVRRKLMYGHRFSYELFVGPVPDGLELDHLCRNRGCVNPEHLEPVTPLENNRRSPLTNWAKTHCPQRHPYSDQNTRMYRGRRYCRPCSIERSAAWRAARARSDAA